MRTEDRIAEILIEKIDALELEVDRLKFNPPISTPPTHLFGWPVEEWDRIYKLIQENDPDMNNPAITPSHALEKLLQRES